SMPSIARGAGSMRCAQSVLLDSISAMAATLAAHPRIALMLSRFTCQLLHHDIHRPLDRNRDLPLLAIQPSVTSQFGLLIGQKIPSLSRLRTHHLLERLLLLGAVVEHLDAKHRRKGDDAGH